MSETVTYTVVFNSGLMWDFDTLDEAEEFALDLLRPGDDVEVFETSVRKCGGVLK